MTSTTFFILFIPILSIILLLINLILAPHNPYQEKDSAFECGFHSFLGQNRTQFSISFFIFGLLFLLFDLEILLVYPYSVSSYTNDIYGLTIMMVFFVLLTLGFIFELGKNALTIESKQILNFKDKDKSNLNTYISSKADIFIFLLFIFLISFISLCYFTNISSEMDYALTETASLSLPDLTNITESVKLSDNGGRNILDAGGQARWGTSYSPDRVREQISILTKHINDILAYRASAGIPSKHVTFGDVGYKFYGGKIYNPEGGVNNTLTAVKGLDENIFIKMGDTKVSDGIASLVTFLG